MKRGAKQSSDRTGPHRFCGALLIESDKDEMARAVRVDQETRKARERRKGGQMAGGKEDACYVVHGCGDGAGRVCTRASRCGRSEPRPPHDCQDI